MHNSIIYSAISFIFGGIVGGVVVGRIVTKDLKRRIDDLEDQNRKLIDENVELRGFKIKEKEKAVEKLEEDIDLTEYESLRKRYVSNSKVERKEISIEEDSDDTEPDTDYKYPDEMTEADLETSDDKAEKIKLISERQFNEEINYRDREDLTYYQIDGTLVDGENEVIMHEETIIGSEAMDIIDETLNDDLYVLDEDEGKVYDISIEHNGNYMRDVLGVGSV